jgi:hypothetical protein
MRRGIVERERTIEMHPPFCDVSSTCRGNTHDAVCYQERGCRGLLLGERQESRGEFAHGVAIGSHVIRGPGAIENREQQQRVFGRLSERVRLFDQQMRSLRSRLGLRRSIPFDMHEWIYERHLKLDLFATKAPRAGQGGDLVQRARELRHGLHQRRPFQ